MEKPRNMTEIEFQRAKSRGEFDKGHATAENPQTAPKPEKKPAPAISVKP